MWAITAHVAFAFFMLPTKVRENYMHTVFPLLAIGLFTSKSLSAAYFVLSATWVLNLLLHGPAVVGKLGPASQETIASTVVGMGRMLNAVLNTAVLILWTVLLTRVKDREKVGDVEVA